MSAASYLYIAPHAVEQRFKVGLSDSPLVRFSQLPDEIALDDVHCIPFSSRNAAHRAERMLHHALNAHRVSAGHTGTGYREWFSAGAVDKLLAIVVTGMRSLDWEPAIRIDEVGVLSASEIQARAVESRMQNNKCLFDYSGSAGDGHIPLPADLTDSDLFTASHTADTGQLRMLDAHLFLASLHILLHEEPGTEIVKSRRALFDECGSSTGTAAYSRIAVCVERLSAAAQAGTAAKPSVNYQSDDCRAQGRVPG